MWLGNEADYSSPSSGEVKHSWRYIVMWTATQQLVFPCIVTVNE